MKKEAKKIVNSLIKKYGFDESAMYGQFNRMYMNSFDKQIEHRNIATGTSIIMAERDGSNDDLFTTFNLAQSLIHYYGLKMTDEPKMQ